MAKSLAWVGGGLALLVAAFVLFFTLLFNWNTIRAPLAGRAGTALGRSVSIDGDLTVHLGSVTRIRVEGLRLANPPWASRPDMARIERADVAVRLWPLLRGRVVLADLTLVGPDVKLEKNDRGEANWHLGENPAPATAAKAVTPKKRSQVPVIEKLVIRHGSIGYVDQTNAIDIDSQIDTASGGDPAYEQVSLHGQGRFKGEPARIDIVAGSLLALRESDRPYPIHAQAAIGATRGLIEGTVGDPVKLQGIDLRMRLEGPDLAAVFPIFGVPVPRTRAYRIEGHLERHGDTWSFRDFAGRVGDSDLSGSLSVATGDPRPLMRANLVSRRLALDDLAGFIGAKPGGGEPTAPPGRVLPDRPLHLERLRAMDMEVSFRGDQVEAPGLPIDALDAKLAITDGKLTLKPLSFAIAQGSFAGTVVLDGRRETPQVQLDMDVGRMNLQRFFANTRFGPQTSGMLAGRITLAGKGRSTAEALAHADGRITLAMAGGTLSALVLEASSVHIADALGIVVTGDAPIPVRCLVADFGVRRGIAASRVLVLDTTDTVVTGTGSIDLASERLDLRLKSAPKHPSPLSARSPITIGGSLDKPDIGIEAGPEVARGGIAAALGALLTPLAAVLPFLEPGLGEDQPCGQLIQQAQTR
ncbi:MAG: AsmA family protein [Solirubrobacterales bacterium]